MEKLTKSLNFNNSLRSLFMASAKQIAWRKKFAKLYGKKKAGSKSTKSTYVKDVLTEQKTGKIGGGTSATSLIGQYKTTNPKKYPAWRFVVVRASHDKNSYLPIKFATQTKGMTVKKWHLQSITGMKDLIRKFQLRKF